MKNSNKKLIAILIILLLALTIWVFRDKIQTLSLNNFNKPEYVMISSQRIGNDASIKYLDKDGKETKIVNINLMHVTEHGYNQKNVYISSGVDKELHEITKDGELKKIKFDSDRPNGITQIFVKENKLYFIQNIGYQKDYYLSRLYVYDIEKQKVIYNKDLEVYVSGIMAYNSKIYIVGDTTGINGQETKGILYVIKEDSGELLEKRIYDEYAGIDSISVDEKGNIYLRTYIGVTEEELEEAKTNSKWNSDYKREIKLLKDNFRLEPFLDKKGKKRVGKIFKILNNKMYIEEQGGGKIKVIDLNTNEEIFSIDLEGPLVNDYIKGDNMYLNTYAGEHNKLIIYNMKENKIIKEMNIKTQEKHSFNLIFPIRND